MKRHLLITAIIMALVMCFSFGALAADIEHPATADDANDYVIKDSIVQTIDTANLYIGTVADWKAGGSENFPYVDGRKTFFENGEAINDNDIIITNGKVGAVLAVGTRNPWGYPAGSILDAGTVGTQTAKQANRDTVWSIEALINGWDSWAPDNCGTVTFDLVKYNFETKKIDNVDGIDAIRVDRDYTLSGSNLSVVSYYGIGENNEYIYMFDSITNEGSEEYVKGTTRFAMTNKGDDGGSMYQNDPLKSVGSYGISSTGATYSISLNLPGENISSTGKSHEWTRNGGAVGYKELRTPCNYAAGESVTYDEYIVISDSPSLEPTTNFLQAYHEQEQTTVSGIAKFGTTPLNEKRSAVIVTQNDTVYGWYDIASDGTFEFTVPQNDDSSYKMYIECDGKAAGESIAIDNSGATDAENELFTGEEKADLTINLKDKDGNPVWGKVEILGEYPTVRYTGDSVFQATTKGVINAKVSDIDKFTANLMGEGYYFYSEAQELTNENVESNVINATIDMKYTLPDGWLAADLHHHANKNDAFADPEEAIPSMLASGLDIAFISDHDFTVNNYKGYQLTEQYGMAGFIPSEEISSSWAHFNVIPQTLEAYNYFLDQNAENHVMDQFAQLPTFVKQTHDAGATITANHPWYSYGLFYANDIDAIPGDYTDEYDNIEINSCCTDNENIKTINSATEIWNSYASGTESEAYGDVNKAHYLVGGSDTHDVLYPDVTNNKGSTSDVSYATGKIRTVAKTDDKGDIKSTGLAYANAVADGNSYVTLGPVLNMNRVPGETYAVSSQFATSFNVQSLSGIKDIVILSNLGNDTYTYEGKDDVAAEAKMFTIENVYEVISAEDLIEDKIIDTVNDFSVTLAVDVPGGAKGWVAYMFVDKNDFRMFALTNPYWVEQTSKVYNDTTHWGVDAINYLSDMGAINGYPDGSFRPDNKITRAEFAAIVARLDEFPVDEKYKDIKFSDVLADSADNWYYDYVMELARAGIISGYENGEFRPNDLIKRSEISKIMAILAGWNEEYKPGETLAFSDIGGEWYTTYIQFLGENKLVNGYEDGTFRPTNNATRAESAQFIYNVISKMVQ